MKFCATRPAFVSPSLQPNQMAIECNGKTCRIPLGRENWDHLPVVSWPLFRAKPTWLDCHAKETPPHRPGGSQCRPGFWRPGSHSQPPEGWFWNSHNACWGHWAGPGERQWLGACPGAGEHWTLPICAHLASHMRMQFLRSSSSKELFFCV